MLNIAICDDDLFFGNQLISKVRLFCARELPEHIICDTAPYFNNADRVLAYLKEGNRINIILLDIDMPGTNGFELAWQLNRLYPDILIIFVSAYDNFVYSSFDYNPFSFLRKGHLGEELFPTLRKAVDKCLYIEKSLAFDTTDGEQVLRVKDILFFESDKNYYVIHHSGGQQYKCRGTLSDVEKRMEEFDFYRVHSAYIVNLDHIRAIRSNTILTVTDGQKIYISAKRFQDFKKAYMKFSRKRLTDD